MADLDRKGELLSRMKNKIPEPIARTYQGYIRPYLPDVSFVTLHYLYFTSTCLVTAIIFWGSSTPSRSVRFIDSLFLTVSAMTEAGLNTVNLSTLNTFQQIILFLLIMMGSAIFVSSAILHIRKRAFEKKLEELAERKKRRRSGRSLTFSFSRRRGSGAATTLEEAIASGAVRGHAIHANVNGSSLPETTELKDRKNENPHGHEPDRHHSAPFDSELAPTVSRSDSVGERRGDEDHSARRPSFTGRNNERIKFEDDPPFVRSSKGPGSPERTPTSPIQSIRRTRTRLFDGSGVGARGLDNHPRNALPVQANPELSLSSNTAVNNRHHDGRQNRSFSAIDKYLETINGYIGRNSQFHNLNEKERRKLGGIEYDAICLLSYIVPMYFVLWQLLSALGVGAYIQINRPDLALQNGLNPFWTGAFFAISAFNNSGMALLDANATVFQNSYYFLLTMSLLILAGNTCFPPFLRLIIWTLKTLVPKSSTSPRIQKWRIVLTFILDHPRRVYTNLFPSAQTWWLVFSLVVLNGTDWVMFEVLNIGNPAVEAIPAKFRALDGLFQAFAVRCGGFYVVNISQLRSGLLVLYVLMMYVSAMPVAMTMRNTNVYEERSLGIFSEDQEGGAPIPPVKRQSSGLMGGLKRALTSRPQMNSSSWTRADFFRQQLQGQLSNDLWFLALAVFFITVIETGQFERNPVVFATFNIVFEVVSAYGTVGISTGVPWAAYSFSGAWHTGSKLILCGVMLRGRHRGLPVAIDKAVLLPDETLAWAEEEDAQKRRRMSFSKDSGHIV